MKKNPKVAWAVAQHARSGRPSGLAVAWGPCGVADGLQVFHAGTVFQCFEVLRGFKSTRVWCKNTLASQISQSLSFSLNLSEQRILSTLAQLSTCSFGYKYWLLEPKRVLEPFLVVAVQKNVFSVFVLPRLVVRRSGDVLMTKMLHIEKLIPPFVQIPARNQRF